MSTVAVLSPAAGFGQRQPRELAPTRSGAGNPDRAARRKAHRTGAIAVSPNVNPIVRVSSEGRLRLAGRVRFLRTAHGARSDRRVRFEASRGRHSVRRRREARRIWPNRSL